MRRKQGYRLFRAPLRLENDTRSSWRHCFRQRGNFSLCAPVCVVFGHFLVINGILRKSFTLILIFYYILFQYLEIEVKNPRTHIKQEKALYTDYEIELKVNNL